MDFFFHQLCKVKITADINVSTMVGHYYSQPFCGTFDGCGDIINFTELII